VGPIPTLPPNPKPPPTSRSHRVRRPAPDVDHDLVLDVDQPAATTTELERDRDPTAEEAALRAHCELAEAEHSTHPPQEPEPLGRRLPPALGAGREGVER
jgi:hypothetical protein